MADDFKKRVVSARKGNREEFASLFSFHINDLYLIAAYCLKDEADAVYIVHKTAYDVFHNLPNFKDEDSFYHHLLTVLSDNIMKMFDSYHFSGIRLRNVPSFIDIPELARIKTKLNTLADLSRLIFVLHIVTGLNVKRIAHMTGLKESVAAHKLERAEEHMLDLY